MITRAELLLRRFRRRLSRSELFPRLLGLPPAAGPANGPGLVLAQIDGLSHRQLERALAAGEMPFVARLLRREGYALHSLYSGVPASTPAFQAELLYGVKTAVPAFSFRDDAAGGTVRMFEPAAAARVERDLVDAGHEPLLTGGSSYSNIYTGGAAEAHFCPSALGWGPTVGSTNGAYFAALLLANAYSFLRVFVLAGLELVIAAVDGVRGTLRGERWWDELRFVPLRVAVAVLLRELVTIGAKMDVARGLPVVYVNLVGYDEHAHRRGPSSRFAHRTLKGIDDALARIAGAAARSEPRHYDVWVFSDHGQEDVVPYVSVRGETLEDAVARLAGAPQPGPGGRSPRGGAQLERARWLGGRLARGWPAADAAGGDESGYAVTGLGPLGMIYAPPTQSGEGAPGHDRLAAALAREAGVPLVLQAEGTGAVRVHREGGVFTLPADAGALLGHHPHPEALAADLVRLCRHPKAGELVACGWRSEVPLTFADENGAHGGIGTEETRPFALLPGDVDLGVAPGEPGRALHLREAALRFLGRRRGRRPAPAARAERATIRVMTYNVHGCLGMDGRLSPERIARVIARLDPDVVALQELDVGRSRSGGVDQAHRLAEHLEMSFQFHPSVHVEEERYGDAVLSRLPMELVRGARLPGLGGREPRGALWVRIETGAGPIELLNTHLGLSARERRLQAAALLGEDWLGHPDCGEARILCGDLNAVPWSGAYRALTRGLNDVQAAVPGRRPRPTFGGRLPALRLDHILVGAGIEVVGAEVPDSAMARVASDHLPLVAELRVAPGSETRDPDRGGCGARLGVGLEGAEQPGGGR